MSEDFTLYRGESGQPHVLAFRCAHRGTQLSTGWVEGDSLRCFYHGWRYDPDGQCVEQPAEPEPFCSRIRIRSYPAQEYLGLIFAYFGGIPGEIQPPELPRYELFDQEGSLSLGTELLECNYFHRMDNAADPAHTKFVHRWPNYAEYGLTGIPKVWADEQPWGVSTYITWPEWPADEVDIHHVLMPNMLMNRIDHGLHLAWRVPVDDESSLVFNVSLTPAGAAAPRWSRDPNAPHDEPPGFSAHEWGEAVLKGAASIQEALGEGGIGSRGRFNLQDYVAQVGQGTIVDHAQEHLGRTDFGISLLRRVWARELQALEEGQQLTHWQAQQAGLAEWGPDAPHHART
jgi:5,5'-dehydrodivanillate O-demethylase